MKCFIRKCSFHYFPDFLFYHTVAESEDSDWSETDDELLEPGIKKAKREKALQKHKRRVQKKGSNDSDKSTNSAKDGTGSGGEEQKKRKEESKMEGVKEGEEEGGGSQKGSTK